MSGGALDLWEMYLSTGWQVENDHCSSNPRMAGAKYTPTAVSVAQGAFWMVMPKPNNLLGLNESRGGRSSGECKNADEQMGQFYGENVGVPF